MLKWSRAEKDHRTLAVPNKEPQHMPSKISINSGNEGWRLDLHYSKSQQEWALVSV